MTMRDIAAAMHRVEAVLRRRPEMAIRHDAPATARWQCGMRVVSSHANGTQVSTDLPVELGGSGEEVTPGWLFRASLASCAASSIVMSAAAAGIELAALEVVAASRSDARGLFGMRDADGTVVPAKPGEMTLHVRIAARSVSRERLRALVENSQACSPVPVAVSQGVAVELRIEIEDA